MVTSDAAGGVHRLGSSSPWSIQPGDHRQQIRLLLRDGRHRPGHGCCRGRHRGAGGTGPPRSWLPPGRPSRPWSRPRSFNQNVDDFAAINAVYARYMPEPARSAPANVNLPRGLLISIGAVPVAEMRDILEHLTKTGVPVPDQLRDKLDKYHQIDVIDVDIQTQRGYFDYVLGHGHLPQGQDPGSKASERHHGSHQPSPPTRPRTLSNPRAIRRLPRFTSRV